ncbi:MAG: Pyrophosphate--fructose 6-phosphate 1-phosphotransferase [Planctomycetes bacterium ADurb.Bin412]|nr:MAG: Pyrophosphate--fructose 6-phosphate 1-phosphotransferase [Planctomycetes bacterium ADurb.Bin412]
MIRKGNAIIGQSGGPTSVINASLAGIVQAAGQWEAVGKVLGMRYGIEGFMQGKIMDLGRESAAALEGLKTTPASALGSCRHKLKEEDLPAVLEMLKRHDIRYLFLIGGNDTMDTVHRVEAYARKNHYELVGIGVPKTVDNDLFGTDHTPGFASAARYMALSVMQAGILARDMQKVDQFVVFQAIGRSAGWLAAAAALGKKDPSDAPHLLCLPERPFEKAKFLADVKRAYEQFGYVSVICGEGITYADGRPVSASETTDKFSNVEFGAMGGASVAMVLHRMIAKEFGFRGEFQITESLPMCAADRSVPQDIDEAYRCGQAALQLARQGKTGLMVTLVRESNQPYRCTTGAISLSEVAVKAKPMPDTFINAEGNFVTPAFLEYLTPLVGELPHYTRLAYHML